MNRKITDFAFGVKSGWRGAKGQSGSIFGAALACCSSAARARAPSPTPLRRPEPEVEVSSARAHYEAEADAAKAVAPPVESRPAGSTAERGDLSVAAIRRGLAAEDDALQVELERLVAQATRLEAAGNRR